MNNDAISQAIVRLFEHERFYAEIIAQMTRILNPRLPSVAGVSLKNGVELHINPDKFAELPLTERVAVLKHECEHILRDHIPRGKELAPDVFIKKPYKNEEDVIDRVIDNAKHRNLNIAMDLAINCDIPNIPEWGQFPKNYKLKDGETFEWYMEQLKDNEKAKSMSISEYDGHSLWAESEGSKEALREKIRQAINKAAQKTRSAGCMTGEQELLVSKLNQGQTINWKQQLKRFVAKSIETRIESSKKKRNRRYGVMFPGSIKTEELHIGVAIDTSGSVSDQALTQFMHEIEQISKYAKITMVEADSEIKNSYIFKPKKEYKISGRGGTAYQPAFDFFNEEATIDALIYFGDMDAFDSEEIKKPKYPVLWAIVGGQNPPADFGKEVRIVVSDNTR